MSTHTIPIQTGPVYACFACGNSPATLLQRFTPCGSPLDAWSNHIWYLKLPCGCQCASRVVRLGNGLAPLPVANGQTLSPADIPTIRAALSAIARQMHDMDFQHDDVTRVVYGLLAGALSPDQAVAQLRLHLQAQALPDPQWVSDVSPLAR